MLRYRGKNASKKLEARRLDGDLKVPIPNTDIRINVVDEYKHLGIWLSLDGSQAKEALHRVALSMAAYTPLANRIFGSKNVAWSLRCLFAESLVFSRLLFNCHILVPSKHYIVKVNSVYMRVVRKLIGQSRFGGGGLTDYEVRQRAGLASIDCVLMKRRLLYLQRIVQKAPGPLLALLAQRSDAKPIPWVGLVRNDMQCLWSRVATQLPDPQLHPKEWLAFVMSSDWSDAVSHLFFDSMLGDKIVVESTHRESLDTWRCPHCPAPDNLKNFISHKALASHIRTMHKVRTEVRFFAPESGKCMVCKAQLQSRLRLIAHLSDTRVGRDRCRVKVLSGTMRPLASAIVANLDEADRTMRREAKQSGRSHPIAVGQARKADGKAVGHVNK